MNIKDKLTIWLIKFIETMKGNQIIFICGDFNYPSNPFQFMTPLLPFNSRPLRGNVSTKQYLAELIMFYPFLLFEVTIPLILMIFQIIVQQQPPFNQMLKKQKILFYKINKMNALKLNQYASQKFHDFTCFYNYIKYNLKNYKVIQKVKKTVIPQLNYQLQEPSLLLKDLASQYQNDLQSFYKKIKRITILNPNQREGGIFSYYKDENGNLHFGQEAISNCLNVLGQISHRNQLTPLQLPTLVPLNIIDIQEIQQNMSSNKAIGYDGISDIFLKTTKNYNLLFDLWQNSTLESNPSCCQARIIPLNKAFPQIPSSTQFRPISVLSSLFKFLELRFLPQLQNYMEIKLCNQQTGFVPKSSTQIHITNILNLINSFRKADRMNCIFIDFSNAFNSVNRTLLFQILIDKQILFLQDILFLKNLQPMILPQLFIIKILRNTYRFLQNYLHNIILKQTKENVEYSQ